MFINTGLCTVRWHQSWPPSDLDLVIYTMYIVYWSKAVRWHQRWPVMTLTLWYIKGALFIFVIHCQMTSTLTPNALTLWSIPGTLFILVKICHMTLTLATSDLDLVIYTRYIVYIVKKLSGNINIDPLVTLTLWSVLGTLFIIWSKAVRWHQRWPLSDLDPVIYTRYIFYTGQKLSDDIDVDY